MQTKLGSATFVSVEVVEYVGLVIKSATLRYTHYFADVFKICDLVVDA